MLEPEFLKENRILIQTMMKIPALNTLAETELHELLRHSEVETFEPGDLILKEGGYDGRIYYLLSGRVKIVKRSKTLIELQRIGDLFGEMGFLEGKASSASVYAVTTASCLAVDVADVERFSSENKYMVLYLIYREFAEVLANRLRMTTEELTRTRKELAER